MSFRLGDILKEHYPVSSDFKRFSVGWYREKKLWKSIEPSRGKRWETAGFRPYMVIHTEGDYVYLILFTTSSFYFPCDKDKRYGIEGKTPCIDMSKCEIELRDRCSSLRGESKVFKRRLRKSCKIVLRIKKNLLKAGSYECGRCTEEDIPQLLKDIFRAELKEWGLEV